jgi:hypothetical protein
MISLVTCLPPLCYLLAILLGLEDRSPQKGARSPATAGAPAAAEGRERLCDAMMASVRPFAAAWSLPRMPPRCKAFSKDTPIIPLISSSGNALGSHYAGYIPFASTVPPSFLKCLLRACSTYGIMLL